MIEVDEVGPDRAAEVLAVVKAGFGEFRKANESLREDGGQLPASFTKAYASCKAPFQG